MHAVFSGACPNCGGDIDDERLLLGVPCRACLDVDIDSLRRLREELGDQLGFRKAVLRMLRERGRDKRYRSVIRLDSKLERFERFFNRATGFRLWSAQRSWARRVLLGRSFTIIAPTGVGKTLFGSVMALYVSRTGRKKSYIVLPTTLLVKQVSERLERFIERVGRKIRLAYYHTLMPPSARRAQMEAIKGGEFDILVTTSQFLARNFEALKNFRFSFIFVDDVDALLKASKNIDRVLMLVGFNEEAIETAYEIVKVKVRLAYLQPYRGAAEEVRELRLKLRELERSLRKLKRGLKHGQLIISSATGRPRGLRVKVFRELLGFEVGSTSELLRNVVDVYVTEIDEPVREVVRLVKRLGPGGLIFVPLDKGSEFAKKIVEALVNSGVKAVQVRAGVRRDVLDRFSEGEIDVLVGVATYYGLIVRGIDLPHRIRYAVFAGVPKFRFDLELKDVHPVRAAQLMATLLEYLDEAEREKGERLLVKMRNYINRLPTQALREIHKAMLGEIEAPPHLSAALRTFLDAVNLLRSALSREEVLSRISESRYISLRRVDGELKLIVPDTMTYIQASGRTSRLFAGGISKGLSIVLVDDEKVFAGLARQLEWFIGEYTWVGIDEADLDRILEEVDRDRELIRALMRGEMRAELRDPVKSALLIVESPNKARTIAGFFGRPSRRRLGRLTAYEVSTGEYLLTVIASGGHVYDLSVTRGFHGVELRDGGFIPIYTTIKRCLRCGEQFVEFDACPRCGSRRIRDSIEVIRSLRQLASEVDLVMIGTDPDVEGEKIGWDLAVSLAPYSKKLVRIEFHEVTKPALQKALGEFRDVDMRLVEAQIVRRIEDRWIGFELSRRLWERFNNRRLSAGRVQTPVLGWVIQRHSESEKSRRDVVRMKLANGLITYIELTSPVKSPGELKHVVIKNLKEKVVELRPPPPYTTDSMLRDASAIHGFGASEAMRLAQDLFELGLITYHRTDSTRVSATGIALAREYITEHFGEEYYRGRSWGEGGAHECIRPTKPIDALRLRQLISMGAIRTVKPLTQRHYNLYDMIFRRFMASQMVPALVKIQSYTVSADFGSASVEVPVEVVKPGYTVIQPLRTYGAVGEGPIKVLEAELLRALPKIYPYTQGEVIQLMRDRGIGRPSTYAKIVSKLIERRYIKGRRRLIPTQIGIMVYKYLIEHYEEFVSEERTRLLERKMYEVEVGRASYIELINELYNEIKSIE